MDVSVKGMGNQTSNIKKVHIRTSTLIYSLSLKNHDKFKLNLCYKKVVYARADTAKLKWFFFQKGKLSKFKKEHIYENILLMSNTKQSPNLISKCNGTKYTKYVKLLKKTLYTDSS